MSSLQYRQETNFRRARSTAPERSHFKERTATVATNASPYSAEPVSRFDRVEAALDRADQPQR